VADVQSIPGEFNLEITKGAPFDLFVNLVDRVDGLAVDLTNTTVTAGIKRKYSDSSVAQAFTCTFKVSPTAGQSYILLDSSQTAALTFDSGVYEVLATTTSGTPSNTKQVKLLTGNVLIK
jgi:hypothetical protein